MKSIGLNRRLFIFQHGAVSGRRRAPVANNRDARVIQAANCIYTKNIIVSKSRFDVVLRASQDQAASPIPPEEQDFDLLSTKISDLVKVLDDDLKGCSIYLVGMMGSGKSTVGKLLAGTLKYKFFDVDTMIEMTHDGKKVSDIFKEFGQDYFRGCESQVLQQLAPYKSLIIATGGGAVLKPMNWSYMQQGVVVWLQGPPDLLARRVTKDGLEKRPLLADATSAGDGDLYNQALAKVTSLLTERTKFYENADLKVNLEGNGEDVESGAPTAVVMYRILVALQAKIQATKDEREAKKNFVIEGADSLKTMRTIDSPLSQAEH